MNTNYMQYSDRALTFAIIHHTYVHTVHTCTANHQIISTAAAAVCSVRPFDESQQASS